MSRRLHPNFTNVGAQRLFLAPGPQTAWVRHCKPKLHVQKKNHSSQSWRKVAQLYSDLLTASIYEDTQKKPGVNRQTTPRSLFSKIFAPVGLNSALDLQPRTELNWAISHLLAPGYQAARTVCLPALSPDYGRCIYSAEGRRYGEEL